MCEEYRMTKPQETVVPLQRVEFGLSPLAKELEPRSRSKGEAVASPPRARRDEEIGFNGKPGGSTQAQADRNLRVQGEQCIAS